MVHLLFQDFLDNPQQYHACEAYWADLVNEVTRSLGEAGEWQRWVPRYYGDGKTPIDVEDLPIYDGRSTRLDRAFRIHQHPQVGNYLKIVAWLRGYDQDYPVEYFPRHELFVGLGLSTESAHIAESLLRMWMTPTTTVEEMQSYIDRMAPPST